MSEPTADTYDKGKFRQRLLDALAAPIAENGYFEYHGRTWT